MSREPRLFISYSRLDEPGAGEPGVRWATEVIGHLRSCLPDAEIWLDAQILGGDDWNAEIEKKLNDCDAFVLLVSRHSLASKAVLNEIDAIRARQARGDKVRLHPLLLTPTGKASLRLIDDKQIRPSADTPLSGLSAHEQMREICRAGDEIADLLSASVEAPGRVGPPIKIRSREELRSWLADRPRDVAETIAGRAALRVLPLYRPKGAPARRYRAGSANQRRFSQLTVSLFRCIALARVAGSYPTRANDLRAAAYAAYAAAAAYAAYAAAAAAAASAAASADAAAASAAASADAAAAAAAAAASADAANAAALWAAVSADAQILATGGAAAVADLPLWPQGEPAWAKANWSQMQALLPPDEDWRVWTLWFDDRLRGAPSDEAYDLAFADWPDAVWKKGPKHVNAEIRERLAALGYAFPDAVPRQPSPVNFGWNARRRIEPAPGGQNLPLLPHPGGEEDLRQTLDLCRTSAQRLLGRLQAGGYNVRSEYASTLADYLEDLPAEAGVGNILLAHQSARYLEQLLQSDDAAPEAFAIALQDIVKNQKALDPFYEIVERHEEAVAKSKWTARFPVDAARAFIDEAAQSSDVVEDDASAALGRVEQASPPAPPGAAPASGDPAAAPETARSHWRQVATGINAFWDTFLKGREIVGASPAWLDAGHRLARPASEVLTWLRNLGP